MICKISYRDINVKSILSIFLVCLIIIMSTFIPYHEAKAFVPIVIAGVAISGEAIAAGATLLCAAGLMYASTEDGQRAFTNMYVGLDSSARTLFAGLKYGYNAISDALWNLTKSYVDSKYVTPNTTVSMDSASFTEKGEIGTTEVFPYSISKLVAYPIGDSWTTTTPVTIDSKTYPVGSVFRIDKIISGSSVSLQFKILVDGVYTNGNYLCSNALYMSNYDFTYPASLYLYRSGSTYTLGVTYKFNGTVHYDEVTDGYYLVKLNYQSPLATTQYTVKTTDIVGTPAYDYKNTTTGTRAIVVPKTDVGIVGKTYKDIQTTKTYDEYVATPTTPYSNSWTGKFSDCATGDYTFTGTGTYTGTMGVTTAGDWAGTWGETVTGKKEWTGTYTGADALTWTGTATESIAPPEGGSINWEPLKISGTLFTTKFPFSLPWDLLKTFQALLIDNPTPPVWNIGWYDEILGINFNFKLDLSRFDTIFKIARVFVLISLMVGLIMSTRKLLGGAT